MKKFSLLLGVALFSMSLNAQENKGLVGINSSSPRATLDVQVSSGNVNGTTNEGLIIPALNKTRLANIANDKLVDRTVVSVDNLSYNGSNTKVSEVTEKGLYYYHADEQKWKKLAGKTYTGQDGIQVDNDVIKLNETTRTNLEKIDEIQKKQMVPLRKVKKDNRTQITGVDGVLTYDGNWIYNGVCKPVNAWIVINNNNEPESVNTNALPAMLRTKDLNVSQKKLNQPLLLVGIASTYSPKDDTTGPLVNVARSNGTAPATQIRNFPYSYRLENDGGSVKTNTLYVKCRVTDLWLYEE